MAAGKRSGTFFQMPEMRADRIIRSRRRTLALEITRDARLVVRVPAHLPSRLVEEFLFTHRSWILKKQRVARENFQESRPKEFVNGETFPFLGAQYRLCLVDDPVPFRFENDFFLSCRYLSRAKELFVGWYKDQAERTIAVRLARYATMTGLQYENASLSNAKRRWGSASGNGRLRFNWRLIMAPLEVIDYVVVHELMHLVERNHSRAFWERVREVMPEYAARRAWLGANGCLLSFFERTGPACR